MTVAGFKSSEDLFPTSWSLSKLHDKEPQLSAQGGKSGPLGHITETSSARPEPGALVRQRRDQSSPSMNLSCWDRTRDEVLPLSSLLLVLLGEANLKPLRGRSPPPAA